MNNSKIFYNGTVITVNASDDIADAVVVEKNRIIYVGNTEKAMDYKTSETELVDLEGKILIPGFIDSHIHMAVLGANTLAIDLRYPEVKSIEDIKMLVRKAATSLKKGQWIRGWGYDDSKLLEKRSPNKWDLDEAAPDNPVMLTRVCAHISTHNSMSLSINGLNNDSTSPKGGLIEKNNGEITGVLKENAHMAAMKTAMLSAEEMKNALAAANDILISQGITSIHDSGGYGFEQMRSFQKAVNDGDVKIRTYLMVFSFVENLKFVDEYIRMGFYTGFGNERVKLGPIKLMLDGSSSGPTAATIEPYSIDENYHGIIVYDQKEVDDIILRAHKANFQVTAHAVGDKAVEMMIDSIENALDKYPRNDHRHRIEHNAMANDTQIDRIKKLGIVPVSQPVFLYEFGDGYLKNYGEKRGGNMFPCKSYIDKGVISTGSSDCPITFSDPLLNIHTAVNRTTQSGEIAGRQQRISALDALRMLTINGAYASFEDDIKGSIEVGKLADMAVLSDSPIDVPVEKIKDIEVEMTIIDGDIVYRKK